MDIKALNEKELEQVSGGWNGDAPASIAFCPCCGGETGAGTGTGRNPMKGLICCHNQKCRLVFEVILEGEDLGQYTGNFSVDGKRVDLTEYQNELREKGII